jgi:hypothetical protein
VKFHGGRGGPVEYDPRTATNEQRELYDKARYAELKRRYGWKDEDVFYESGAGAEWRKRQLEEERKARRNYKAPFDFELLGQIFGIVLLIAFGIVSLLVGYAVVLWAWRTVSRG